MHRLPIRWSIWLVPIGLMAAVGFTLVSQNAAQDRLGDSLKEWNVEVVSSDFNFHFRYPGEDCVLASADDRFGPRNLYVPAGAVVRLRLKSQDYVYTFEIPEVGVYEIAAPDLTFEVRFTAPRRGKYALLGSQMCGYDHPELLGELIVQSPAEYKRTMTLLSAVPFQTVQR